MWFTDAARNAAVDAVTALVGSTGKLKLYSGALAATAAASGSVFTSASHGYANADVVTLVGVDAAGLTALQAAGFTADARYYVISSATNTFQLALTAGGSAITVAADIAASKITVCKVPATISGAAIGTLLDTVTLGAWAASSAGTSTGADPAQVTPAAAGAAGYAHLTKSDDTIVWAGSVSKTGGGGYVTLTSVDLTTGVPVDMSTMSLSLAAA